MNKELFRQTFKPNLMPKVLVSISRKLDSGLFLWGLISKSKWKTHTILLAEHLNTRIMEAIVKWVEAGQCSKRKGCLNTISFELYLASTP